MEKVGLNTVQNDGPNHTHIGARALTHVCTHMHSLPDEDRYADSQLQDRQAGEQIVRGETGG